MAGSVHVSGVGLCLLDRAGQKNRPEALLVHVLVHQKTPDRAPPTPAPGAGGGERRLSRRGPAAPPTVVHCRWVLPDTHRGVAGLLAAPPLTPVPWALSAGIGRTGCLIVTSICCQQLRHEGVVDILKTTQPVRTGSVGRVGPMGSWGAGEREQRA